MRLFFGRWQILAWLGGLSLAGALAPAAWAQAPAAGTPAQALELANGLFDRELWSEALAKYEQFITASPHSTQLPGALLRAGECLFKLEQFDKAQPYYQRLTTEYPEAEEALHGWYRLGDLAFRKGNLDEAGTDYQKVLDKSPKGPLAAGAAYWLGETLYRQGKVTEAVAAYERCLAASPDANFAAYATYSIGLAKIKLGDLKSGQERLEGFLKKYPQHDLVPEVVYLLGEASFLAKDYEAAAKRYQQVVDEYPKSRFALLARCGLGRRLCVQGKYAEALPLFQEAARGDDPEATQEASLRAGDCLFLLGRYGEAATSYTVAADARGYANAGLARFWQAMSLERKGDKAAARKAFEQFTTDYPDNERAGEALLHLGDLQAEAGALEAAEKSYQAAEKLAGDEEAKAHARYGAAWAAYQRHNSDEGLQAIEAVATDASKTSAGAQAAFQVGRLRVARKEYSRAIQLLSQLVQTHPDDPNLPETLYLLGAAYELSGSNPRALDFYQRTWDQYPQTSFAVEALSRLVVLNARGGDLKAAQALADKLATRSPNTPALSAAQLALADALLQQKDYTGAATRYQAVLDGKPEDLAPQAQYGLGACYAAQSQYAKAAEAFRACLTKYPKAPNASAASYQLAVVLTRQGDDAGAAKQLEDLLAADPQGDLADDALLDLSAAYTALKQNAKALAALDRLARDFAQSPLLPDAQFRRGEVQYDSGDYAAAQAAYEKLLETTPQSPLADEAAYKLGWALLKQDKSKEAIAPFTTAAEKADDPAVQADARYQLAMCLLKQGQFAEAAKVLAVLRQKPPAGLVSSVLMLLGQAYLGQKDYPAASAAFRELLAKFAADPLAPRAQLNLGRALKGEKKYDEAATVLTKTTGATDKQVAMEAQFDLAETRRLQGDLRSAAIEYLKVAILYDNQEWGARAQYAAGLCYEQVQAPAEALKAYKGVLELYKGQTEWVQKAQERLRALE